MDVHGPSGVITVYKTDPFMTFIGGSIYNMDTNAFRLALKDWEDNPESMTFPDTHRHNTTVLLGGIEYARIIEILAPYTITFDDTGGGWVCNLLGSNNNILDRTNLTSVQVRSNNSAGLVQTADIEYSSFQNAVWVDTVNGTAGTIFPAGTPRQPVNNFADAKIIANYRGFKTIHILGSATLDATADFADFEFIGQSANLSALTIHSDANVVNCEIRECHVTGTLDGGCILRECMAGNLNYVNGILHQTLLHASTITLGGGPGTMLRMLDCYSGTSAGLPTIDFNNSGTALGIRGHSGDLRLVNNNVANSNSVYIDQGHVILDSTITAGEFIIRGSAKLTDNSGGTATVDSANLVDVPKLVNAIWATPEAAKLALVEAILRNKVVTDPVTGVMTVYADDGVAPLLVADVFEDAAGATPYRGQGANRRERLT